MQLQTHPRTTTTRTLSRRTRIYTHAKTCSTQANTHDEEIYFCYSVNTDSWKNQSYVFIVIAISSDTQPKHVKRCNLSIEPELKVCVFSFTWNWYHIVIHFWLLRFETLQTQKFIRRLLLWLFYSVVLYILNLAYL